MNVILNVTSGVVAKEEDFFLKAFGSTESEYLEILSMPDDFIRYRSYFEGWGLHDKWRTTYRALSDAHRAELLCILSECEREVDARELPHSQELNHILIFYSIKRKNVEKNLTYYTQLFSAL